MSYPKQPGQDAEAHLHATIRCMELSAELAAERARAERFQQAVKLELVRAYSCSDRHTDEQIEELAAAALARMEEKA